MLVWLLLSLLSVALTHQDGCETNCGSCSNAHSHDESNHGPSHSAHETGDKPGCPFAHEHGEHDKTPPDHEHHEHEHPHDSEPHDHGHQGGCPFAHGHDHDHGHDHPHDRPHDHPHDHDHNPHHNHPHDHGHDHHEHSHEPVGHHHHGHEGGCPFAHTHKHQSVGHPSQSSTTQPAPKERSGAKSNLSFGYDLCREFIYTFAKRLEVSPTVFGALASTVFVGVVPIFLLLFIPLVKIAPDGKKTINHSLLKVLLAFAVGGLLGDVFLHLYPHAISPHSHGEAGHDDHDHGSHDHQHGGHGEHNHDAAIFVGLYILAGIFLFFIIEKLVILFGGKSGHSHGKAKADNQKEIDAERLRVSGILNVIADFVHNFTDGMAISSSFLVGIGTGLTTAVAVCIHEIPHEIGDLAILVKSGATPKQVIFIQLGTALGCVAGAVVGLFVGSLEGTMASEAILPVTAGGFIYVATCGVIPQLFESTSFGQSLLEALAMIFGVAIMAYIAFELE